MAGLRVDNVFGHMADQCVGNLLCGSSPEFFNGFLRKETGMWRDDHTFIGEERLVEVWGFRVENIQGQPTNLVLFECSPCGLMVDEATARGVDQDGMAWHRGECLCVDQMPVVFCQWAMKRDDVAGTEKFVPRDHRTLGSVIVL